MLSRKQPVEAESVGMGHVDDPSQPGRVESWDRLKAWL
jgi:hypothetical protein